MILLPARILVSSAPLVLKDFTTHRTARKSAISKLTQWSETLIGDGTQTHYLLEGLRAGEGSLKGSRSRKKRLARQDKAKMVNFKAKVCAAYFRSVIFFKMVSRESPSQSIFCQTHRAVTEHKTVTTVKVVYALERQGCTLVLCTDLVLKSDNLQGFFALFMTLQQMKEILARATVLEPEKTIGVYNTFFRDN